MRTALTLACVLVAGCGGDIGEATTGEPTVDAAIEETSSGDDTSVVVVETSAPTDTATDEIAADVPMPKACIKNRELCATTGECCEGNVCDVTWLPGGAPTDTRCCKAKSSPCVEHDDCCSYLLCNGGACSARALGGDCRVDGDCVTNKCTGGKCVDPTSSTNYRLPLRCGGPYTVTQGNFDTKCGVYSHTGLSQYAYDWGVGLNTPVLAMKGGVVTHVRNDVKPGNPCYSGGGSSCINTVNYVTIKHPDGFGTVYVHLNDATVSVGQTVVQGQQIGLSGGTGWSTGPHMHVQKQQLCSSFYCQSVPLIFEEYPAGRLDCGMKITSKNGC